MYERFTTRANKVMALANQEAQRLNHNYLGSEHILLGLVKEGSGVGATVLRQLDIDFRIVKQEVEKLIPAGKVDNYSLRKIPQNEEAKSVIKSAMEYAIKLGHNYVGTEHLLYGVAKESNVSKILASHNVTTEQINSDLESLLGISRSDEEDTPKPEPESWIVPRNSMGIEEVIKKYGFKIESEGSEVNIYTWGYSENSLMIVGKIKDKKPFIIYDLQSAKQIQLALDLREVCEINQQDYLEQEPLSEVAKKLRDPHEDIISLVNRLEKIISKKI